MLADVQKRFYERTYAVQSAPRASLSGRLVARFEQHRVDAVADLVERGGCMLDIGCGDGRLVSRCSHWFDRVIGLDVAAVRLRRAADSAAHRGLGNVSYAAASVDTGLPILDASVDVATIVQFWDLSSIRLPHWTSCTAFSDPAANWFWRCSISPTSRDVWRWCLDGCRVIPPRPDGMAAIYIISPKPR
jgi:SAM-dependent methyltransferase